MIKADVRFREAVLDVELRGDVKILAAETGMILWKAINRVSAECPDRAAAFRTYLLSVLIMQRFGTDDSDQVEVQALDSAFVGTYDGPQELGGGKQCSIF